MPVTGHVDGVHRHCGAEIQAFRVVVFQEPHWTYYHAGMLVTNCPSCGVRLQLDDIQEEREEEEAPAHYEQYND